MESIRIFTITRGNGYLEISGKFAPEEVEYAREAIDESFESLRQGSLSPERFAELKERVISTSSLHQQDPESLGTPGRLPWWPRTAFLLRAFPTLLAR